MGCVSNGLKLADNKYIRLPNKIKISELINVNELLGLGTYSSAVNRASLNLPTNTNDYIITNVLIEETNTIIQNARPTSQGLNYTRYYNVNTENFSAWVADNGSGISRTIQNMTFNSNIGHSIIANETNFYNTNSASRLKLDIFSNANVQNGDKITITNNGLIELDLAVDKNILNFNPVFEILYAWNYIEVGAGENIILVYDLTSDTYLMTRNK